MAGIGDYQFQSPDPDGPPQFSGLGGRRGPARGVIIVIALAAAAVLGYLIFGRSSPRPAQQADTSEAPAPEASTPAVADKYVLPPLADSDEFIRDRMRALSSDSLLATWLGTSDLVRNLVVIVENSARGLSPSKHLRVLRPTGQFRVIRQPSRTTVDPRNYERFNGIAAAAMSIDPAAAGALYTAIKPLLQMAYDELGNQEPIDGALERALSGLLMAPVPPEDARLEVDASGIGYRYQDPQLEHLTGAQKQLMRMGPANMRAVQGRLRQFGVAAGIPAQRLP